MYDPADLKRRGVIFHRHEYKFPVEPKKQMEVIDLTGEWVPTPQGKKEKNWWVSALRDKENIINPAEKTQIDIKQRPRMKREEITLDHDPSGHSTIDKITLAAKERLKKLFGSWNKS